MKKRKRQTTTTEEPTAAEPKGESAAAAAEFSISDLADEHQPIFLYSSGETPSFLQNVLDKNDAIRKQYEKWNQNERIVSDDAFNKWKPLDPISKVVVPSDTETYVAVQQQQQKPQNNKKISTAKAKGLSLAASHFLNIWNAQNAVFMSGSEEEVTPLDVNSANMFKQSKVSVDHMPELMMRKTIGGSSSSGSSTQTKYIKVENRKKISPVNECSQDEYFIFTLHGIKPQDEGAINNDRIDWIAQEVENGFVIFERQRLQAFIYSKLPTDGSKTCTKPKDAIYGMMKLGTCKEIKTLVPSKDLEDIVLKRIVCPDASEKADATTTTTTTTTNDDNDRIRC